MGLSRRRRIEGRMPTQNASDADNYDDDDDDADDDDDDYDDDDDDEDDDDDYCGQRSRIGLFSGWSL